MPLASILNAPDCFLDWTGLVSKYQDLGIEDSMSCVRNFTDDDADADDDDDDDRVEITRPSVQS